MILIVVHKTNPSPSDEPNKKNLNAFFEIIGEFSVAPFQIQKRLQ